MQDSKIALVTGGNRGIGREVSRQLAAKGMTVLVGVRDEGRGEHAVDELQKYGDVRALLVDVTDSQSVAEAAKKVYADVGRLDVLINNAGVITERTTTAAGADVDQMRETFETNILGVVRVTNAFLPLLLNAPAPRMVNMSSFLGSLKLTADASPDSQMPTLLGYATSKTALNALTTQYATELRDKPIKINSADPGYVSTDLNGHTGNRSVEEGAAIVVTLATLDENGPSGGFFNDSGEVPW